VVAALQYARSIASDKVQAVSVDFEEEATAALKEKWERWGAGVATRAAQPKLALAKGLAAVQEGRDCHQRPLSPRTLVSHKGTKATNRPAVK